jgi:thiol-disulfide isomerase/thioredoxin
MNNNIKIFVSVIVILIVGTVGAALINKGSSEPVGPGKYDTFAQCLKDKGAVFYGAFWCPHCQEQKKLFGSSQKLLPYVECSTADGQGQLQVCKDQKIEGYPTWKLADGTIIPNDSTDGSGVMLKTLAEKI